MFSSIIARENLASRCFLFIEKYFKVKFTRKSYDNENLRLFFKFHWITGDPISVALVIMREKYWHITHIATHENFRDRNHASRLIKKIIKRGKKAEVDYISCNIRETNIVSRVFFERFGFSEVPLDRLPKSAKIKEGFHFYQLKFK
jgi:ribosomal protein S18 acetylase RimI-like enzyme